MQRTDITALPNANALPLSVADAKAHMRVEIAADDTLIQSHILAACKYVEQETQKRVIEKDFRLVYNCSEITGDVITLEQFDSGITINAFTYFDENDTEAAVGAALYAGIGRWIQLKDGFGDLSTRELNAFKIEYTVSAAPITAAIEQALKMIVAHWYENREAVGIEDSMKLVNLPLSVKSILMSEKIYSV